MTNPIDFEALRKPFPSSAISWRVGKRSGDKNKGQALPYLHARAVQLRLDEVLGPEGWKSQMTSTVNGDGFVCTLFLKINGEWIGKADIGAIERPREGTEDFSQRLSMALKGAASDAFKRAAVLWGIGRYLYEYAPQWVPLRNERWFALPPELPLRFLLPEEQAAAARARAEKEQLLTQASETEQGAVEAEGPVGAEPDQPRMGTDEQWNSLRREDRNTIRFILARIAQGIGARGISAFLSGDLGHQLPQWVRENLLEISSQQTN